MKFTLDKPNRSRADLCRKLGYTPQSGDQQEFSCVRPVRNQNYPRFHLFIESKGDKLLFKLHLDQKKPSYGRSTIKSSDRPHAHSGEYESKPVKKEAERIKRKVEKLLKSR